MIDFVVNVLYQPDNPVVILWLLFLLTLSVLSHVFAKRPNWERKIVYAITDIRQHIANGLRPPGEPSRTKIYIRSILTAWINAGLSVTWFVLFAISIAYCLWDAGSTSLENTILLFAMSWGCILAATIYKNSAVRHWLMRKEISSLS